MSPAIRLCVILAPSDCGILFALRFAKTLSPRHFFGTAFRKMEFSHAQFFIGAADRGIHIPVLPHRRSAGSIADLAVLGSRAAAAALDRFARPADAAWEVALILGRHPSDSVGSRA